MAVTYTRRFAYNTILGLLVDQDDDGKLASEAAKSRVWIDDIDQKIESAATVADLTRLFNAMPPEQRVETTASFTKRKLEINNANRPISK